eukprot:1160533-Pelagomonas_calceolata.AAC.20
MKLVKRNGQHAMTLSPSKICTVAAAAAAAAAVISNRQPSGMLRVRGSVVPGCQQNKFWNERNLVEYFLAYTKGAMIRALPRGGTQRNKHVREDADYQC